MSLRIRRLKLIANTLQGNYGADLVFPDGLVLINLDNTRGKSTALKAIVYGLGLERMFGQVDHPPLTPAMTTRLEDGDKEWAVAESWVYLEIQNGTGKVATLRRKAAGADGQDKKVIDVWDRAVLTEGGLESGSTPFFARDPGSAQREQGIGVWLARFIGWDLPEVVNHDGTLGTLYMECLLPLFFVEQSQGWAAIQASTPRIFGIRHVEKKAIEFLLALDACNADINRQNIEQQIENIRRDWMIRLSSVEALARSLSGVIRDFPDEPQATWLPTPSPFIEVFEDGKSQPLSSALESDRKMLEELSESEVPTVDEAAGELTVQLEESMVALREADAHSFALAEEVDLERANLGALETRLIAIKEDLAHNKDIRKLRELGATRDLAVVRGECPTCHQSIDDSLLSQKTQHSVMGLDENIAYLDSQRQTLEKMIERTKGALAAIERKRLAVTGYSADIKSKIRSIRRTLISAGTAPSEVAIRERIVVEERLQRRESTLAEFNATLPAFAEMADRWRELLAQKRESRAYEQSAKDKERLAIFADAFTSALQEFGFKSFPLDTVVIDRVTYKPKREGFDLAYDVSASDGIRIIAAYVTAALESVRQFPSNHPGLMILDEPRQQNMNWRDFAKILKRLSTAGAAGQQVIVATSDRPDAVEELMKNVPHSRVDIEFEGWLLKPIS